MQAKNWNFRHEKYGAQFDVIIKNCQKMGGNHQKVGFDQVGLRMVL